MKRRKKKKRHSGPPEWPIKIVLPLKPASQKRARAFARFSKKTQSWHGAVRKSDDDRVNEMQLGTLMLHYASRQGLTEPLTCPVLLKVVSLFPKPKSHIKIRDKSTWERDLHTAKPDADNLAKAIKDAGTGILWADDKQVIPIGPIKVIGAVGEVPKTVITIQPTSYKKLRKRVEALIGEAPDVTEDDVRSARGA